jgi:hypothetical protein
MLVHPSSVLPTYTFSDAEQKCFISPSSLQSAAPIR